MTLYFDIIIYLHNWSSMVFLLSITNSFLLVLPSPQSLLIINLVISRRSTIGRLRLGLDLLDSCASINNLLFCFQPHPNIVDIRIRVHFFEIIVSHYSIVMIYFLVINLVFIQLLLWRLSSNWFWHFFDLFQYFVIICFEFIRGLDKTGYIVFVD